MEFTKKDTQAIKGVAILMMFFHHCFLKWTDSMNMESSVHRSPHSS